VNSEVELDDFCKLSVEQAGLQYLMILTADNDEGSPQKLSWDIHLPLALHSAGRIEGQRTLYPYQKCGTEILLAKSLAELSENQVQIAMSQPITGTAKLGSKTANVNTSWSELFQK
jgi:hypothetical protein